jgi:hypothetical protein
MRYDHPPKARHLKKPCRIAIWHMDKIVYVLAMGIWVTDIAFSIDGKYPVRIMRESLVNHVMSQVSYG